VKAANKIIAASKPGAKARVVRIKAGNMVTDSECTVEAIHRRADHIGPVMEGILREMEEHWTDNRHLPELN
jgi:hypothetical protein